jgi:hypothetical protein
LRHDDGTTLTGWGRPGSGLASRAGVAVFLRTYS